jgi:hypothetical protein
MQCLQGLIRLTGSHLFIPSMDHLKYATTELILLTPLRGTNSPSVGYEFFAELSQQMYF